MNKTRLCFLLLLILMACKRNEPNDASSYLALTGATVIDGTGAQPIQDAVLLIQNGRVIAIGPKETITIPEQATVKDVSGNFIIPGIINAHGHVGDVKGIEGGHYSAENIIENLSIYARYHCGKSWWRRKRCSGPTRC